MMEAVDRIRTFKELRIGSIMTQKQVAEALGVSHTLVNLIENGYTPVSNEMREKINDLFGEETLIPYDAANHTEKKADEIRAIVAKKAKPKDGTLRTFREIRKSLGVTQKDIAAAVGVCISTISMLENGKAVSADLYNKLSNLFDEDIALECREEKEEPLIDETIAAEERTLLTNGERKFLKTCWNMRDALKGGRMLPRDIVDATYEYMDDCEAITYLYKWYKMGFYYFPNGGTVDQGYFLWDKLPGNLRRVVKGE